MKKLKLLILSTSLLVISGVNSLYSDSFAGGSLLYYLGNDLEDTMGGSVRLGKQLDENSLLSLEIGYVSFEQTAGAVRAELDVVTVGVNYLCLMPLEEAFSLYFGGGIGVGINELSGTNGGASISLDDTTFAYHLDVGVNIAVYDNMDVQVGYRYFGEGDLTFAGVNVGDVDSSVIELGINFKF